MGKEGIEPPLRQSTLRIYSPRRPNQYSAFAHVLFYYENLRMQTQTKKAMANNNANTSWPISIFSSLGCFPITRPLLINMPSNPSQKATVKYVSIPILFSFYYAISNDVCCANIMFPVIFSCKISIDITS